MNNGLILILSIIGLLALYWALIGQWKWNRMMRASQENNKIPENETEKAKK